MQPPPLPVQPLDYESPSYDPGRTKWIIICVISLVAAALFLGMLVWGFGSSPPSASVTVTKPPMVIPAPGLAPNLVNTGDLETQAAATAASNTLDDLLAGKLDSDPNLAPVARKVSGYQSWSITSITAQGAPPARTFGGMLKSGDYYVSFSMQMVKQRDGLWRVGVFNGPSSR